MDNVSTTMPAVEEDASYEIHALRMHVLDLESRLEAAMRLIEMQKVQYALVQSSLMLPSTKETHHHHQVPSHRHPTDTPFIEAASKGDHATLVAILEQVDQGLLAKPDADDVNAALVWACWHGGSEKVVKILVDRAKADVHVDYESPLLWACRAQAKDIVQALLERGGDPNALDGSAMRVASVAATRDIFDLLVKFGGRTHSL